MNTTYRQQEDLLQLSSTFSKMLKQKFGKGPESCFVTNQSNKLTIYIRNFITPAEEVLVESKQINLAYNFRYAVIERVFQEFKNEVETVLGLTFTSYHTDWDYDNNTGILMLENSSTNEQLETSSHSKLTTRLFKKMSSICSEVHKAPSSLKLIKLNPNMYLAECKGTMLQIEKVLFRKNCIEMLQERSIEIKKSYIIQRTSFEEVFGKEVEGLFMTWDYKNDRSYIFFYLQS
ncbi:MAG: DUF2294 domain-containing protein [Bacillaceae bacterium]|nr:DUF2294 domain-containing protein [Bacillaceae bacterium]